MTKPVTLNRLLSIRTYAKTMLIAGDFSCWRM